MKKAFWIVAHVTCGVVSIAVPAYMLAKRYAAEERKKGYEVGVEAGRVLEGLNVMSMIMKSMNKKKTEEAEETNENDD